MDNTVKVTANTIAGWSSGMQLIGQHGYYREDRENPYNMAVIRRLTCDDKLPKATARKIWEIEEMELGWN